jgi:hypothetical protein
MIAVLSIERISPMAVDDLDSAGERYAVPLSVRNAR